MMDLDDNRSSEAWDAEPAQRIRAEALGLGASLVGMASVDALQKTDSNVFTGQQAEWHERNVSVIVIALEHPRTNPELDWWKEGCPGGTEGNQALISIIDRLCEWFAAEQIETKPLPYQALDGGIFLKHAAVMSGLGCMGRNNLLLTPEYGPRIRLRAMLVKKALPGISTTDFDPCRGCSSPCLDACPQQAFSKSERGSTESGIGKTPGRDYVYHKSRCDLQMARDISAAERIVVKGTDTPGKLVRYCRLCELACPVGKH